MKFEPGDKVALKKTAEEGIVISILDKKMVVIAINGIEFPVFESEIEHPYFNWFTDKKFITKKADKVYIDNIPKEKHKTANLASFGMHLVMMPVYKNISDDDVIEKVKVYISNNQAQAYGFHYYFASLDGETFTINSEVAAYSDFYLHDISYEHLATNPYFEFSCAEIISNIQSSINQFQTEFSIKPKKLFSLLQEMHFANKPFFTHFLFNTQPHLANAVQADVTPWAPKQQKTVFEPKNNTANTEKTILPVPKPIIVKPEFSIEQYFTNPYEIDLHIEKIFADHINLSSEEKINFQLEIFAKALDMAILKGQNSLIIIHGVGKGVLKNKIHELLNQTKQVHSYVNQFDNRYGFGATEIFFGY
jgi:hypothetical protein